ncbi:helix-turn-helix transcriptional regulator [Micromonospora cathayae]|uniref:Helix-turn-helix transcriptional regulator n=1 Tax=Micromonospora cathayae TaxID=3028804 RepID=A0ABY8A067_9ACTN|nr:helix-turn-helix transcriptional regulator [Micromonospora sp. HUAS 3]WDZ87717.1 helix-turn-helix transcriptional regulator [Micromonospora sp. HUAS 3]
MTSHVFTLVLDRQPTDDELATLQAAGCDDGAFGMEDSLAVVEFDREAPTMADAIASAVRSLEAAGLGVTRVLDQDLLTLADIADRIGQSRESIRRYASGTRGPGGFPPPVNPSREGTLFYRWSEVAPWIRHHLDIDVPDADPALVVANLILQARKHRHRVQHLSALSDLLAA